MSATRLDGFHHASLSVSDLDRSTVWYGLDHLAFSVPTSGAIEGWAEHLSARGIEHSGVIEIPSGAILDFRDPDGIQLAIFWEDGT